MLKKVLAIALTVALISACALAEGAVLTVQGSGAVTLNADKATVALGIRKYAPEVRDVQQAVNRDMEAVIAVLMEAGVQKEELFTSSIGIYPEYNYDTVDDEEYNRIRGYSASNSITFVTDDIENVGALIDIAFDAGANTLDDVSFSASDTREASNEALRLAIGDARAKAEVMAEAAGMALGGVVSISEGSGYSYTAPALFDKDVVAESEGAATRVIASRQSVTASVTVQFELLGK